MLTPKMSSSFVFPPTTIIGDDGKPFSPHPPSERRERERERKRERAKHTRQAMVTLRGMAVVYFDQGTGTPHTVKSFVFVFLSFCSNIDSKSLNKRVKKLVLSSANGVRSTHSLVKIHIKWQSTGFFNEKKKGNLPILQPSLQFYCLVLEKTTAEECHGCHSKNDFTISTTILFNIEALIIPFARFIFERIPFYSKKKDNCFH